MWHHWGKKTFIVLKTKLIYISHLSMHLVLLGFSQYHDMFHWNTIVNIISSKCGMFIFFYILMAITQEASVREN